MKNTLTLLFVVISLPVLSLSETPQTPGTPTWAEASAQIEAKMLERQARETARKAAIEAVSAFEEWEVDHGNRKTILRRVAPPIPLMGEEPKISSPAGDAWTEEEFTAWIAAQPVPRTLNLSTVVYDHSFTKITWREEETGEEWTVLSNIDFRYLSGIGSFEDENHHWQTFLFVDEVDSEKETQTARLAHTLQMQGESQISNSEFQIASPTGDAFHTAERWLNILPSDFLPTPPLDDSTTPPSPEYIIIAEHEKAEIPQALYEELDALHHHYQANEERLIAEYKRRKVMNEARRAYREANPPEPKDTVINFWRVE